MKKALGVVSIGLIVSSVCMATNLPSTYLALGGGYVNGSYASDFTRHVFGSLTERSSFNQNYNNYFAQLGLGTSVQLNNLEIVHQVTASKLMGSRTFDTTASQWEYKQNFDFGYNIMPLMHINDKLVAAPILGIHYAQFSYKKDATTTTKFDADRDQLGFGIGAMANYRLNDKLGLAAKFEHLQYASTTVSGSHVPTGKVDDNELKPTFNLIGLQLNYYIS